jgi:hypothetical protein
MITSEVVIEEEERLAKIEFETSDGELDKRE